MPTQSPFEVAQQNMGRTIKSMLDLAKETEVRQTRDALTFMHSMLGMYHAGVLTAMRDLHDVQADLVIGISTQYRSTFDYVVERSGAFLGDLRQADDRTEVMGVLAMFASDMSERMHADAERLGKLVTSAEEAGKVLVARTLDRVISDDANGGANGGAK